MTGRAPDLADQILDDTSPLLRLGQRGGHHQQEEHQHSWAGRCRQVNLHHSIAVILSEGPVDTHTHTTIDQESAIDC